MKNRRDVCYAKDAGFIQFDGLPGSIKTGCQATPAYMSRYCDQHKACACVCDSQQLSGTEEDGAHLDAPIGPMLRSKKTVQELGEPIVEVIVAKKTTCHQTYYKVMFSTCMVHTNPACGS